MTTTKLLQLLFVCLFTFVSVFCSVASDAVEFTVKKIWDAPPHSAFTDLVLYHGEFYCTFREGTGHIPGQTTGSGDGEIRVIKSTDGETWESVALLKKAEYDLRDSKLSETPDGRLMLTIGGSIYVNGTLKGRHCQVSFSDKQGSNFSDPEPIKIDDSVRTDMDWLWRVTWHKGTGYGVVYRAVNDKVFGKDRLCAAGLLKTVDGIHYDSVTEFPFPLTDAPNEATVRFDEKDKMYVLIRREGGGFSGCWGVSEKPYTNWTWTDTGKRLGGPNFIFLPDSGCLIGSRTHDNGVATALYKLDTDSKMVEIVRFPSGGDTSYPGLLVHKNILWVSYYSSHEGKTCIYLAKCPLDQIIAATK